MGRRALKKVDPSLDLSRHLCDASQLAVPFDAVLLFGRTAPVELEIGSGKGLFLVSGSGERPDHDFVGCEIAARYARFAAAKLARTGRTNACVIHGDAQKLLPTVRDGSVRAVHVYFPDPWWKRRHRERRIMNSTFLAEVCRVLESGGRLHFWTDVEEYFHETLKLIADTKGLRGPEAVVEREPAFDLDYRTHFERRMRTHGLAVYRAEFTRPES